MIPRKSTPLCLSILPERREEEAECAEAVPEKNMVCIDILRRRGKRVSFPLTSRP
jgi:hypothetical protein